MKASNDPIDYGLYIDDGKAFVVCTNEFEPEEKDSVRLDALEYAESETYCKTVVAKLHDPNRVVIFGPTDLKYELFTQLQHVGFGGINSMEVVITTFMETDQQAEQFTLDYFESRPSF